MLKVTHRMKADKAPCTYIRIKVLVSVEAIRIIVAHELISNAFRLKEGTILQRQKITRDWVEEQVRNRFRYDGEEWLDRDDSHETALNEAEKHHDLSAVLMRLFPDWFGSASYQFIKNIK